jgi:putative Holliday junction resolvase
MDKILALDPGDQHIGTAISDELQMLAEPYKTVKPGELKEFLTQLLQIEPISTIVVGYPKTMRGTISAQTQKSIDLKDELALLFPNIEFVLWDERLTSKSASHIKQAKNKNDRLHQHSIAAAIILQTFLDRTLFN